MPRQNPPQPWRLSTCKVCGYRATAVCEICDSPQCYYHVWWCPRGCESGFCRQCRHSHQCPGIPIERREPRCVMCSTHLGPCGLRSLTSCDVCGDPLCPPCSHPCATIQRDDRFCFRHASTHTCQYPPVRVIATPVPAVCWDCHVGVNTDRPSTVCDECGVTLCLSCLRPCVHQRCEQGFCRECSERHLHTPAEPQVLEVVEAPTMPHPDNELPPGTWEIPTERIRPPACTRCRVPFSI